MKNINILGVKYQIREDNSIISQNVDGLCKYYDKKILIRSRDNMLCPDDTIETKNLRYNEVLRHEIIHAFFDESGLDNYSCDEQLVQWIAYQWPKIQNIFDELGVANG